MDQVVSHFNAALHAAMQSAPDIFFLGEDILDPYGGAFKVSRGLSDAFPDQVLPMPISEQAIVGMANGLALAGKKAIAEMMFADFAFLAFDQIVNFAAKTVSMYGARHDHSLIVRCPVGGHRGYGATHSQTVQKHFIGVPNLALYELSPLHDMGVLLPELLASGQPSMLCESKTLYPKPWLGRGPINELFVHASVGNSSHRLIHLDGGSAKGHPLILCGGTMIPFAVEAAQSLLMQHEKEVSILVPWQIYPFDTSELTSVLEDCTAILAVEESTGGGTWGAEAARQILADFPGWNKPPSPTF